MAKLKPIEFNGGRNPERRKMAEDGRYMVVFPSTENSVAVPEPFRKTVATYAIHMKHPFVVDTLEGRMEGKAGDFLAIGAAGELYPVDHDIFLNTYEKVK